jgi:hypothetical protein
VVLGSYANIAGLIKSFMKELMSGRKKGFQRLFEVAQTFENMK